MNLPLREISSASGPFYVELATHCRALLCSSYHLEPPGTKMGNGTPSLRLPIERRGHPRRTPVFDYCLRTTRSRRPAGESSGALFVYRRLRGWGLAGRLMLSLSQSSRFELRMQATNHHPNSLDREGPERCSGLFNFSRTLSSSAGPHHSRITPRAAVRPLSLLAPVEESWQEAAKG